MKAEQTILTRQLPKTGQSIEYQAGDDGTYEAGWWKRLSLAANKTRFIAKTIGVDKVVIDRATGLMWAADGNEAGCNGGEGVGWAESIIYAESLSFAGFADWRVPNTRELFSLIDLGETSPLIPHTFFPNTYTELYWTSTTYKANSLNSYTVSFSTGEVEVNPKGITSIFLRCVWGGL